MAKKKKATEVLRSRNREIRKVRVSDLEDAPWNFRTHSDEQAAALDGAIDEIGFYGYVDCYETPEGNLRLCDGHLRKKRIIDRYGVDAEIEVNVTDFDEKDAKKATLTKDPIAAMADTDAMMLAALMQESEPDNKRPGSSKEHPTMKPVELFARCVSNSSKQGWILYEPFSGSGTTLIAAEQLSRKCYGMEIDPIYCDVIVKRWENLAGVKAKLSA